MECSAARLLFDRFLENQLTPVQSKVLEDHLGGCPTCSLELKRFEKVFDLVDDYFQGVRPREGFVEDVMVGVEEASAHRKRRATKARPVTGTERRSAGPKLLVVGVVLVAVAAAGYFLIPRGSAVAEVVEVKRTAKRRAGEDGAWENVLAGSHLLGGETIRSEGGTSRLYLEQDRSEIILGPGAELTLDQSVEDGVSIHRLLTGAATFVYSQDEQGGDGDGRFEIRMPTGSVKGSGIARFSASVAKPGVQACLVEVSRGEVQVRNSAGEISVAQGKKCDVPAGKAPTLRVERSQPDRTRRPERRDPVRLPGPGTNERATKPEVKEVPMRELISRIRNSAESEANRLAALTELAPRAPKERADAVRRLMTDILQGDPSESLRKAALRLLVGLGRDDLFDDVLAVFEHDPSLEVRRLALQEMAKLKDFEEDLRRRLFQALQESYPPEFQPMRIDIVRQIARRPAVEDIGPLLEVFHASLEDDPVRTEILRTLGGYRFRESGDALIETLRDSSAAVRSTAIESLRKITGRSFQYDARVEEEPEVLEEVISAWETWWAENRHEIGGR